LNLLLLLRDGNVCGIWPEFLRKGKPNTRKPPIILSFRRSCPGLDVIVCGGASGYNLRSRDVISYCNLMPYYSMKI
jgi:hypothetical protein